MKSTLASTITYIFWTLFFGFLWNMIIFKDLYTELAGGSYREAPLMQFGMMAIFIEAIALSILFKKFYDKDDRPHIEGLQLGLLVGIFSITYASLVVCAKFDISPLWKYLALEISFGAIHFGVAGILFGLIYKGKTSSQTLEAST